MIQMFSSKQMKELEKQAVNSSEYVEIACLALAEVKKTCKLHRCLEMLGVADTVGIQYSLSLLLPESNVILLMNLLFFMEPFWSMGS